MNTAATPSGGLMRMSDKTQYRQWSDGSFRREPPKLRGKAAVKAAKRARRK